MAYIDPAGNAFNNVSSESEIYLNDGDDSVDALYGGETVVYGGSGDDGLFYDGAGLPISMVEKATINSAAARGAIPSTPTTAQTLCKPLVAMTSSMAAKASIP